jgi:putative membrane protein
MSIANGLYRFFLIWYVCGVVLLTFDWLPPWLEWANAVFLYASGLLAYLYLQRTRGTETAIVLSIFIMVVSMFSEWLGVEYGLIFGTYRYEKDFGVQLFGVPLTIGFAWLMVIVTGHVLAKKIIKPSRTAVNAVVYAAVSAWFAVIMDLLIDPVSFVVKQYWLWEGDSFYYGIPLKNFSGWFIVSFFLQLVFYVWQGNRGKTEDVVWEQRMKRLYFLILSMFALMCLTNGLYLAIGITAAALAAGWFVKRRMEG